MRKREVVLMLLVLVMAAISFEKESSKFNELKDCEDEASLECVYVALPAEQVAKISAGEYVLPKDVKCK